MTSDRRRAPRSQAGKAVLICQTCAMFALTAAFLTAALLAPVVASAQVRIGVAGPFSGSDAVFGTQLKLGVEQATADINAAGGFLGQRGVVVLGDDLGDPKRGVDVAKGFVRDHLPFVIGHFSSSVTIPSSAIYGAANVLEIVPAATVPQITERGLSTVFRLAGRDDQQSLVAARFLVARHYEKIAILHDRTSAGKALADSVRKALASNDVKDVLYAGIDKGDKDFGSLIARLKASGAQVAFWGGTETEAGLLARQLREANARIVLMGGIGIASEEFSALAGPAAEGTLMTFPADPKQRPEAADLLRRFRANGTEPDAYTFYAYAAVQIIQAAAEAAHSLDPNELAKAMHSSLTFKTVLGDITFDGKGDVTIPDFVVYVWHKGPTGRFGYYDQAGL